MTSDPPQERRPVLRQVLLYPPRPPGPQKPSFPGESKLPEEYYDDAQQFPVHQQRWALGEPPKRGRTHLIINCHGAKYGPLYDANGELATYDGKLSLQEGPFKMFDPQLAPPEPAGKDGGKGGKKGRGKKRRKDPIVVHGVRVSGEHDGHCPLIARNQWFSDDKKCKEVLEEILRLGQQAATEARKRPKKPVYFAGVTENVHVGELWVECNQARHRALLSADAAAELYRQHGFTVEIRHCSCFRGAVYPEGSEKFSDTRGSCGCYLAPEFCKIVRFCTPAEKLQFKELSERCKGEVSKKIRLLAYD